jgi:hypothetical protein
MTDSQTLKKIENEGASSHLPSGGGAPNVSGAQVLDSGTEYNDSDGNVYEVVLNGNYGGFRPSDLCWEEMERLGYQGKRYSYELSRHNPFLVQAVKTLGREKASGQFSYLVVETIEGKRYRFENYDGVENVIVPTHEYDWFVNDGNTHKVVINGNYGGFGPSDLCWAEMERLGYQGERDEDELSRHNPYLIQAVENLETEKASGYCSDLVVVTIEGNRYRIEEYDGFENVIEPTHEYDWCVIDKQDNNSDSDGSDIEDAPATNPSNSTMTVMMDRLMKL